MSEEYKWIYGETKNLEWYELRKGKKVLGQILRMKHSEERPFWRCYLYRDGQFKAIQTKIQGEKVFLQTSDPERAKQLLIEWIEEHQENS